MFRSKSLKPGIYNFDEDASFKPKVKEWFFNLKLVKWYFEVRYFLRRLKRSYFWVKDCIWNNWDFDGLTIYPLLEYKLKRVQFCLKNGHAVQEEKDMKALRILIKLANRLANEYHENALCKRHEERWGKLDITWVPVEGKEGYSESIFSRPKVITEEDEKLEREEYQELFMNKEPKWVERDEKLFFEILRRHIRNLWD